MRRRLSTLRRAGVLLAVLLAPESAAVAEEPDGVEAVAALTEGNRLFQEGQIEAAIEAYRAGYASRLPHPTLAYNLGAAYHHLGRLPEAVLWYRRAGDSGDSWLEDNLWLARRSLASRTLPPSGPLGALARRADLVRWVAVGLAWASLVLTAVWRRRSIQVFATALVLCASIYAAAEAAERWGPRPAVLVAACRTSDGEQPAMELPAGTEAWVRPRADGSFRVAGSPVVCSADAVALVRLQGKLFTQEKGPQ